MMRRRKSFTSQLYRAARLSNNALAASRGRAAYAKHVVLHKVLSSRHG
jgi:hypothetical protein